MKRILIEDSPPVSGPTRINIMGFVLLLMVVTALAGWVWHFLEVVR